MIQTGGWWNVLKLFNSITVLKAQEQIEWVLNTKKKTCLSSHSRHTYRQNTQTVRHTHFLAATLTTGQNNPMGPLPRPLAQSSIHRQAERAGTHTFKRMINCTCCVAHKWRHTDWHKTMPRIKGRRWGVEVGWEREGWGLVVSPSLKVL